MSDGTRILGESPKGFPARNTAPTLMGFGRAATGWVWRTGASSKHPPFAKTLLQREWQVGKAEREPQWLCEASNYELCSAGLSVFLGNVNFTLVSTYINSAALFSRHKFQAGCVLRGQEMLCFDDFTLLKIFVVIAGLTTKTRSKGSLLPLVSLAKRSETFKLNPVDFHCFDWLTRAYLRVKVDLVPNYCLGNRSTTTNPDSRGDA
ncbi:hypothetical protein BU15DRAFT_63749 [Melanogaster broomeanus]|nr:hypothetical protein BU15DRAFT_63749 [Melanogaster broomeanus]